VALLGVVQGSYEDYFRRTPTPGPTPTKWDLGSVDLSLRLEQSGAQVSGFVIADDSLIYPKLATVMATPLDVQVTPGTPGPTPVPMGVGPNMSGSIDGQTMRVESGLVTRVLAEARTLSDGRKIAKQEVSRKFMLLTDPNVSNGDRLIGLYFETLWGYDPVPATIYGAFILERDGAPRETLLLTPSTPAPTWTPGPSATVSTPVPGTTTALPPGTGTPTATVEAPPSATPGGAVTNTPVPGLTATPTVTSTLPQPTTPVPGELTERVFLPRLLRNR
jgi:hypothetical protein